MTKPLDRLQTAHALANASRSLTSSNEHGAAFAAAILSRLATAEAQVDHEAKLNLDAGYLRLSTQFLTYDGALQEFTSSLASQLARVIAPGEFHGIVEDIQLADLPIMLEAPGTKTASSDIFRRLAQRLADDGMAREAGRSLVGATQAAWQEAHLASFPAPMHPLISTVLNTLALDVTSENDHLGHTEMWELLQGYRFISEPTPTALA